MKKTCYLLSILLLTLSCSGADVRTDEETPDQPSAATSSDVARLLSALDMDRDNLREVHTAVTSSVVNGYDEEYTMRQLFADPGAGVGDDASTKAAVTWKRPLRDLIRDYVASTKAPAGDDISPEEYIRYLSDSNMQIYWPYADQWDGVSAPALTFDPGGETRTNVAWQRQSDGSIREIVVDEKYAMTHPVWVVNNNEDASYESLEMIRRRHPDWIQGGNIVVNPGTKSADDGVKTLVLKDITMNRNYDCWLAGGSEIWVKIASVEDFRASTEAELRLYDPMVTDFMISIRRKDVGVKLDFNTVLVSDWTPQLENCALMIVEDDGGTNTSWKCSAVVKYSSKSYGFDVDIPYKTRDDIVWRGQLSRRFIEANSNISGNFGDVVLTFGII